MRERLIELIEECRDACLQAQIPFTSERISAHLLAEDIVEVVRCENCAWYKRENKYSGQCKLHRLDTTNDFYCELGRRAEK